MLLSSLESEEVAPQEVLGPFQAHDFCLLYSKANCIGTMPLRLCITFLNSLGREGAQISANLMMDEGVFPSITFAYTCKVLGTFQRGQEPQVEAKPPYI